MFPKGQNTVLETHWHRHTHIEGYAHTSNTYLITYSKSISQLDESRDESLTYGVDAEIKAQLRCQFLIRLQLSLQVHYFYVL